LASLRTASYILPHVTIIASTTPSRPATAAGNDLTRRYLQGALLLALSGLTTLCTAASFLYEIRGTGSGTNNIWRIDPNAPTAVSVAFSAYPGGNSATLAQCPDGRLYYVINATNGTVYRWNPATPATPPVALGNLGNTIPGSFRFACSNGGVLYYMPDSGLLYTISATTGTATSTGITISGTGSGGDIAFNSAGTLYVLNSSRQLYSAPLISGPATSLGTVSFPGGITPATLGLAFDSAGLLYTETQSPTNLYRITGTAATLVTALLGGTTATGDLAGFILSNANVGVSKAFNPATIMSGSTSTLTVTLSNANAVAMAGATFTDSYPAGVVNATTPATATTCGGTVTAAAAGGSVALSGGTIPAGGSCTVTVSVTGAAAGSYTNTIAARAITTVLAYNDAAASATLAIKSPPTITKASEAYSDPINGTANPKRIPGGFVKYTITVANSANGAIDNNAVFVVDAIPANTDLFVGDIGVAGSGPVALLTNTSLVTYTFISLASTADDLSFSDTGGNGGSFGYTPVANANGVDPNVTHIRINPKGAFGSSTSFQLQFRARIE
jgi:uncharacterized repeat protein (TIGR01451 family)